MLIVICLGQNRFMKPFYEIFIGLQNHTLMKEAIVCVAILKIPQGG